MNDQQSMIILFNIFVLLISIRVAISIFVLVIEAKIRCSIVKRWCELTNPHLEWRLENPEKTYKHPIAQGFIKKELAFLKKIPNKLAFFEENYIQFLENQIIKS